MSYRRTMAALSGGSASNATINVACRLAREFGANVEGFHVKFDALAMSSIMAGMLGMPVDATGLQRLLEDEDLLSKRVRERFEAKARKKGLIPFEGDRNGPASFRWAEATGHPSTVIAREAILYDLIVLGRSDRVLDEPSSRTIEDILTKSGRPVLLAPSRSPAELGTNVAIGWDGSPQAARAVTASMPFLQRASKVSVITIGNEPDYGSDAILNYLAWHGVMASATRYSQECGHSTGAELIAQAQAIGSDLLVMGAFARAPWREALFGGASHEVINASGLPILLAH